MFAWVTAGFTAPGVIWMLGIPGSRGEALIVVVMLTKSRDEDNKILLAKNMITHDRKYETVFKHDTLLGIKVG